jgi:hypothetical protein
MCLNETCNEVRMGKHFSDNFPIQNSLKKRHFKTIAFQLCFRKFHQKGPGKQGGTGIKWDTSAADLC